MADDAGEIDGGGTEFVGFRGVGFEFADDFASRELLVVDLDLIALNLVFSFCEAKTYFGLIKLFQGLLLLKRNFAIFVGAVNRNHAFRVLTIRIR